MIPGADDVYGKKGGTIPPRRGHTLIPLIQILRDPMQPRRATPSQYRRETGEDTILAWGRGVLSECGDLVESLLNGEPVTPDDDADEQEEIEVTYTPEARAFIELVYLAVSIRREGLANPITVARLNEHMFKIETGERRWLAYHLLNQWFNGADEDKDGNLRDWSKIPCSIVDKADVWRQAAENTARANLNAIAKARQFAILSMELHREKQQFKPLSEYEWEVGYYRQGDLKVPDGKRDQLLSAMGFKSAAEITRCRQLLSLPPSVWFYADDNNVPQSVLLECVGKPEKDAMRVVSSWNSVPQDNKKQGKTAGSKTRDYVERVDDFGIKLSKSMSNVKAVNERRKVANKLRELADKIERGE